MAYLYYKCNLGESRNESGSNVIKLCLLEYCLYCCSKLQFCSAVQQRSPRRLWDHWYFWLGVTFLAAFVASSVSNYMVNNYTHNVQGIPFRHNAHINGNGQNNPGFNQRSDRNQISISVIPTTGTFWSQGKVLVIGGQPGITHMKDCIRLSFAGRKCVCTSKVCKEAGTDTCRTRFFCYTELILTTGQAIGESTTTRGCTEGATPLLCETKSWVTGSRSLNVVEPSASPRFLVPWPKLKCCNSHDYCNAGNDDENDDDDDDIGENASTWTHERKLQLDQARGSMDRETSNRNATSTMRRSERKQEDPSRSSGSDRLLRDRVTALHVAAFVLAVAAFISVLASCYVVTRFLNSNRYVMGTVDYL
ncbi:uncharacterized protein LOC105278474 [Ooceraea biroi]|uniref:uncharacterized protein LOC105278474 n=1 Tax=Ooceraea biroi TaxID=2015173 RepID=UPI000F07881C|nr:uncharacterized protein LOC105278474 [Ooceraea biroi]